MAKVYIIEDSPEYSRHLEELMQKEFRSQMEFKLYHHRNYQDWMFVEELMHLKEQGIKLENDLAIIDLALHINNYDFWNNLDNLPDRRPNQEIIFNNPDFQIHGDNIIRAIRQKVDLKMKIVSITSWNKKDLKILRDGADPFLGDKYYRHFQKEQSDIESIASDIVSFYYEAL